MLSINELPEMLETKEAAELLRRRPQTLRLWSMTGSGPIRPIKLSRRSGRLLWRRAELEALLGGDVPAKMDRPDGLDEIWHG